MQTRLRQHISSATEAARTTRSAPAPQHAPSAREPAIDQPAKTILLAEDEVQVRHLLEVFLATWGYEIVPAKDGEEALARASAPTRTIDLLLSDVDMPGISGVALAETLQSQRPELRVILMSGGDWERTICRPSWEFVRKPLDLNALVSKIAECLLDERIEHHARSGAFAKAV